jgi:hypothetical protein
MSSAGNPPTEHVPPVRVAPAGTPSVVEQQAGEDAEQEAAVEAAAPGPLRLDHRPGRPGLDRRDGAAEFGLPGGEPAVGVHAIDIQREEKLLLGQVRIGESQRDRLERAPRGREPGRAPGVSGDDHVLVAGVRPVGVPALPALRGRRWMTGVALEPLLDDETVDRLRPLLPGQRLPGDAVRVRGEAQGDGRGVERVGLLLPLLERPVVAGPPPGAPAPRSLAAAEEEADDARLAGLERQAVVERALRPVLGRIHRVLLAADDARVDTVLRERRLVRDAEEPLPVRLVLGEQQLRLALGVEPPGPEPWVLEPDHVPPRGRPGQERLRAAAPPPRPGVPEPDRREQMDLGRVRTAVDGRDPQQEVFRRGLRDLDPDVEGAVALEDPRVGKPDRLRALAGLGQLAERLVGKGALGVAVARAQVGVRRRGVEVLAALRQGHARPVRPREAEEPLLQMVVAPVPQRERDAEPLLPVTDPGEAVLGPPVRAGAGVLVGKRVPGVAVVAVVLPRRPPGALREVGPPALPVHLAQTGLLQAIPLLANVGTLPDHGDPPPGNPGRGAPDPGHE